MSKNRTLFEVEKDGKTIKLAVVKPKIDFINKIDIKKAGIISEAIREGAMTKSECQKIIKEKGIITEEMEKEKEDIFRSIGKIETMLKKESLPLAKGKKLAKEITGLRQRILEINEGANEIVNLCAEEVAERICMQYYTAGCTIYEETGEKYFDGYEDYVEKSNSDTAIRALVEMIYLSMDLESDYINNLPENEYLLKKEKNTKKVKESKEKILELESKIEDDENHQSDEKEDSDK